MSNLDMKKSALKLITVSINNKLLDVYYSVFDETEVKIESVEDMRGVVNIMEFLNDSTMAIIHNEIKIHMREDSDTKNKIKLWDEQ